LHAKKKKKKRAKNNNSKVPGIIFFWKRYLIAPKTKTKIAT
jgi:hypothetical protein